MSHTHTDDSLHRHGLGAMPLHRLRRHAEQLATHLAAVSSDLDRREAELAAERSQRDCELRSARLWINTRMVDLRDLVEQLQQHVTQIRILSRQTAAGQSATVDHDKQDLRLVVYEQKLKKIDLHLEDYQQRSVEMNDSSELPDDLAQRNAALDLRENALETDRRKLADAYHETINICDAAEQLIQDSTVQKHRGQSRQVGDRPMTSDALQLQIGIRALEEAEQRLQQVYSEITNERAKATKLKKISPPSWVQEREELIDEIHRLQAMLDKSAEDVSSKKAA
jgi:hypothetical protein